MSLTDIYPIAKYGNDKGYPKNIRCKDGEYITKIYGREGKAVYGIGAECSDGTNLGYYGASDGNAFTVTNLDGFDNIKAQPGKRIYHIKFNTEDDGKTWQKTAGPSGKGYTTYPIAKCKTGTYTDGKAVGLDLRYGKSLYNIGLICGRNFRKNCNDDKNIWDKDCDINNPKKVVHPCSDKNSACFAKRKEYCKSAPISDKRCVDFCKVNSGECDNLMTRYCESAENKNNLECTCLNSPALNHNPACIDSACISSGYATRSMMDNKPCPNIVDCRIYNEISKTGGNVKFTSAIEQKCGQPERSVQPVPKTNPKTKPKPLQVQIPKPRVTKTPQVPAQSVEPEPEPESEPVQSTLMGTIAYYLAIMVVVIIILAMLTMTYKYLTNSKPSKPIIKLN